MNFHPKSVQIKGEKVRIVTIKNVRYFFVLRYILSLVGKTSYDVVFFQLVFARFLEEKKKTLKKIKAIEFIEKDKKKGKSVKKRNRMGNFISKFSIALLFNFPFTY